MFQAKSQAIHYIKTFDLEERFTMFTLINKIILSILDKVTEIFY